MTISTIYLVLTPILTSIALLIWLATGAKQPILGPFLNFSSAILAMILIYIFDRPKQITLDFYTYTAIITYTVVNALCTICWIYALKSYSPTVTAFVEISYPAFMVMFSFIVLKTTGLNNVQIFGAILHVVAAIIIIKGN